MKTTFPADVIPIIHPAAVYTPAQARQLLGLAGSTIRLEKKAGRLRISKRGNKYFILGEWLLEWIAQGELPRKKQDG